MATAIDLHEHPFLGIALAPTPMLWLAPLGLCQQSCGLQETMHTAA